jgi:hypothetical protein
MSIDISFPFAKVYHMTHADVVVGQKFSLISAFTERVQWFANNDPVLSLKESGNVAQVEATTVGQSTILILNESLTVLKKIIIRVVENIDGDVTDLGLMADPAVAKP